METGKANKFISKYFNSDRSQEYHLAIQIGLNYVTYFIITAESEVAYYKNYILNNNLTEFINTEKILQLKFAKVSISFCDFPCTLIPTELFIKEKAKEILKLDCKVHDIIKSDNILSIKATLIYTIPKEIDNLVNTIFTNAAQKSQQSIILDKYNSFDNSNEHAYLNLSNDRLDITLFKNNKLIFNNSFDFVTKEDILYYTLFTFEQLKINNEKVLTSLYGEIKKGDKYHQLLYEYIRNIKFGSNSCKIKLPAEFQLIKEHQMHGLYF